jgi:hypothetical protein
MIGHEDISMDAAFVLLTCRVQTIPKGEKVGIGEKDSGPVIPPLDDVLGHSGKAVAREPSQATDLLLPAQGKGAR